MSDGAIERASTSPVVDQGLLRRIKQAELKQVDLLASCSYRGKPAAVAFTPDAITLFTSGWAGGTIAAAYADVSINVNGTAATMRIAGMSGDPYDLYFRTAEDAARFGRRVAPSQADVQQRKDQARGYSVGAGDQVVSRCRYAGGAFIPISQGQVVDLVFREARLEIFIVSADGPRRLSTSIEFGPSFTVELTGPGKVTTGGGFVGGGAGLVGAAEGIAIASFLNAVTTKTTITSVIVVGDRQHEGFFVHTETTPDALRRQLSATFVRLRQHQTPTPTAPAAAASGGDLVSKLERLAALHASGALTVEEFTAAKAALIGGA